MLKTNMQTNTNSSIKKRKQTNVSNASLSIIIVLKAIFKLFVRKKILKKRGLSSKKLKKVKFGKKYIRNLY